MKVSKASGIVVQILHELKAKQSRPFPESSINTTPELPSWIDAGEGQSLIINGAISGLIVDLADHLYASKPELKNSISKKDWSSIVKRVIGPMLGKVDLDVSFETSAIEVLAAIKVDLNRSDWNFGKRTFLFGCSLVSHHDIPPFTVGPVTIRRRHMWLDHALQERRISRLTYSRLAASWSGTKIRPRKPSLESGNERAIIRAVGEAPFVCSIETEGLFGDFAKEKALLAARLTLLGVALLWASPRKALQEINLAYDGPPHLQAYTFYQERPELLSGGRWTKSLHGLSLFGDAWEPIIAQRNNWWATLAEAIEFLLGNPVQAQRPKLMTSFAHALIWFHEACREPMPMIALTKYISCLDALACGSQAPGIIALVSARMEVEPEAPIRADGPSFKSAINQLYSRGRSRLLHGSSDRLGHDWEDQRELAETLARYCLILCFEWAAQHPECDDPKQMKVPA